MALRDPDTEVGPFHERDTPLITAVVKDNATPKVVIPGSALEKMDFTLYSEKSPYPIINSRDRDDLRSSVDEDGNLEFQLEQDDMVILGTKTSENHRILLEWEWDGGKRGSTEIRVIVENELKVPAI